MLLSLLITTVLLAQSSGFEVAVVKPNHSGSGRSRFPSLRNGTMAAENVTLKWLIEAAYGINRNLIYGPPWLDDDRFDVNARAPAGVPDSDFRPMLQALLKTRFHLALHTERRQMDAYDMVIAKGGLKVVPFDPNNRPKPSPNTGGSAVVGTGTLVDLARDLIMAVGKPVVNRTGAEGQYFWDLRYTPLTGAITDNPAAPPDVFTAMQTQLGLKLEARKQPIGVLVVDSVERVPEEN